MLQVFIGFDRREPSAYAVAVHSLLSHSSIPLRVTPIEITRVERSGLLTRSRAWINGQMYDVISQAPMSTDFAVSRFLTPLLAQKGWALFVDCDVVFKDDVANMLSARDETKAVMVVKHCNDTGAAGATKMDGRTQTFYLRKNWSSVMLFNCDHWGNETLTLNMINTMPGKELHAFCWLPDSLIGELDKEWNWLVGVQPKRSPKLAHFTLGGPWFKDWVPHEHDEIWIEAAEKAGLHVLRGGEKSAVQTGA